MRPEVRADYERALRHVSGDDALRHPLRALLHRAARSARRALRRRSPLRGAVARAARGHRADGGRAARAPLRALDHEREITPDWLQREQAVGYVTYVDRFAGTLTGVRERLPYLRELGISYLHLMPLLHARPQPNDGGYAVVDYGAVEPALGTMDDLRALADELRAAGMALCIDVVLNHTAREHPWAQAALAGDARALAFYRTFADRAEPDAYELTLPEVFPATAPGSFTWEPALERWVWTTFNAYQWDLDYSNPEVFRAMAEAMLGPGRRRGRRPAPGRRPLPVEAQGHEQPEPARGPRAAAGLPGRRCASRRPRSPSRPRRSSPRATSWATSAPGATRARSATSPTTTSSWSWAWSALASGRVALLTQRAARDAAGAAGRGLGHLRALPRRHRLGHHRGGRRRRRRGRPPAPALPGRLLRGRLPGQLRARRALPARAAHRRGAHERHDGLAGRARGRARERRRAGARARAASHPAALRGRLRPRRPAARLHGRRARPAQRPRVGGRSGAPRGQPLDAPPGDGLGGGRAAQRTRRRSRGACGTGCAGWSPRAAPRAPPTRRAPPSRCGPATTTSSACCASQAGERLLLLANFTPERQPVGLRRRARPRARADRRTPRNPTGVRWFSRSDTLVLEPYQYLWLRD